MNSFGNCFRITTWGESHGKAVGVVVDGCPAGLFLRATKIDEYLRENDRPLPELATERIEPNNVEILSGVFKYKTIGTPISLIIFNCDVRQQDYKNLQQVFRPGHGDYTYYQKYRVRGLSGGGRASGRECIARLAAGYIAERLIAMYLPDFKVKAELINLAGIEISDQDSYQHAVREATNIGRQGDSSGGIIRLTIQGLPPGLGEPVFHGIDAMLSSAVMSIGAVKSVEIGRGRECAFVPGSRFHDDFIADAGSVGFASNNQGGVLAGISSGQELVVTVAVKPTPSIRCTKTGLTPENKVRQVSVCGRHDKNITPRIIPVAKAMLALVIVDYLMIRGTIKRDYLTCS